MAQAARFLGTLFRLGWGGGGRGGGGSIVGGLSRWLFGRRRQPHDLLYHSAEAPTGAGGGGGGGGEHPLSVLLTGVSRATAAIRKADLGGLAAQHLQAALEQAYHSTHATTVGILRGVWGAGSTGSGDTGRGAIRRGGAAVTGRHSHQTGSSTGTAASQEEPKEENQLFTFAEFKQFVLLLALLFAVMLLKTLRGQVVAEL